MIQQLADRVVERRFAPGSTVVEQDDGGTSLFLVVDGLLEVSVQDGESSRVVAQLVPGQFFGEWALLTGEPRSATVTAETEATLYQLRRDDFAPVLQERPRLAETLSQALAERRRLTDEKLRAAAREETHAARSSLAEQFLRRIQGVFRLKRT